MAQGHDTVRADGGWSVELCTPLRHADGRVFTHIDLHPVELDQVIRWGQQQIPSTLALIAEMSDIPEALLRSLTYPDIDRVMLAYSQVIPPAIRKDFEDGARPLATPIDQLPPEQAARAADPQDSHWPKVSGSVQRFQGTPPHIRHKQTEVAPPPEPQAPEPDGGINVEMPEAARKIG